MQRLLPTLCALPLLASLAAGAAYAQEGPLLTNARQLDLVSQHLATTAEKDASGPKRFAPFLRLYLAGNPLSAAARSTELPALQKAGVHLFGIDNGKDGKSAGK